MSKILGLVATAAMFASVTAFAQSSTSTAPAPAPAASADSSAPADAAAPKMHHMHHHRHDMGMNKSDSDMSADKLNACMSNATPTNAQEACLKAASGDS